GGVGGGRRVRGRGGSRRSAVGGRGRGRGGRGCRFRLGSSGGLLHACFGAGHGSVEEVVGVLLLAVAEGDDGAAGGLAGAALGGAVGFLAHPLLPGVGPGLPAGAGRAVVRDELGGHEVDVDEGGVAVAVGPAAHAVGELEAVDFDRGGRESVKISARTTGRSLSYISHVVVMGGEGRGGDTRRTLVGVTA